MATPKTSFYEIFNQSKENSSVDIMIYGTIPHMDWTSMDLKNDAELFVKEFKKLEKNYDRINIHINSPGGSLYHAFPIFNVIANSKKDIHTYNDGLAASAAGVILMAGKKIHSAKNAFLMIHRASSMAYGNAEILMDQANTLVKYEKVVAEHFAGTSNLTAEEITAKYFNGKDHFLTAEEALEEGFIHSIEDYESEDAPPSDIKNMAFSDVFNLYQPIEKEISFFEKITNHLRETFKIPQSPDPQPKPNTDMNFENSLIILSKETLTAEDISAVKNEISTYAQAAEKFTAEEVENKINLATASLAGEITALSTEKSMVENLVTSLKSEKEAIETIKNELETENNNLKVTIEAYRKSGVQPLNQGTQNPDKIPGENPKMDFTSEADIELQKYKKSVQG